MGKKKKVYINNFIFKRNDFYYYFMYNKYYNNKRYLYKYIIDFIKENITNTDNIIFNNVKTKIRNNKLFIINFDINNIEKLNTSFEFIGIECKDNFGNKFIIKDKEQILSIIHKMNENDIKDLCEIDICKENKIDMKKLLMFFKKCNKVNCSIYGFCDDIYLNNQGLFRTNIIKNCKIFNKKIETIDDLIEFDIYLSNNFSFKKKKIKNNLKKEKIIKQIIDDFYKEINKLNIDINTINKKYTYNNIFYNLLTEDNIDLTKVYYISIFNFRYICRNGIYILNDNYKYNGVRPVQIEKYKNSYRIKDINNNIILKDKIDNLIYDLTIHQDKESAYDSLNKKVLYSYKYIKKIERYIDDKRRSKKD